MARRLIKHEPEPDLDDAVSDEEARELIIEQCMTDVTEILSGAYEEINSKVRELVENLRDE
jgi:hypothetical protein